MRTWLSVGDGPAGPRLFSIGEQETDTGTLLRDIQSEIGKRGHGQTLLSCLPVGSIRASSTRQHPREASELTAAAGTNWSAAAPTSHRRWEHPGGQKSTPHADQTVFRERSAVAWRQSIGSDWLDGHSIAQTDPTVKRAGSNSAHGLSIRGGMESLWFFKPPACVRPSAAWRTAGAGTDEGPTTKDEAIVRLPSFVMRHGKPKRTATKLY